MKQIFYKYYYEYLRSRVPLKCKIDEAQTLGRT